MNLEMLDWRCEYCSFSSSGMSISFSTGGVKRLRVLPADTNHVPDLRFGSSQFAQTANLPIDLD